MNMRYLMAAIDMMQARALAAAYGLVDVLRTGARMGVKVRLIPALAAAAACLATAGRAEEAARTLGALGEPRAQTASILTPFELQIRTDAEQAAPALLRDDAVWSRLQRKCRQLRLDALRAHTILGSQVVAAAEA